MSSAPGPQYPSAAGGEDSPPSLIQNLTGVFFEPEATFKNIGRNPSWIAPLIFLAIVSALLPVVHHIRVPFELRAQAQADITLKSLERFGAPADAIQRIREQTQQNIARGEKWWALPLAGAGAIIFVAVFSIIGGFLYKLALGLMGQSNFSFGKAMCVWVYASWPASLVILVVNSIVMFLKTPEDLNPLVPIALKANLSMLVTKDHYLLGSILSRIDLFEIWGIALAVIAMAAMGEKLKKSQAATVVVTLWVIGALLKLGWSVFAQQPI